MSVFTGLEGPLRPTGQCFDDALEFFEIFDTAQLQVRHYLANAMRIAHGICAVASGETFVHAWVEESLLGDDIDRRHWPREVVWQATLCEAGRTFYAVERSWFYEAYHVRERQLYTLLDAAKLNVLSGHYGPWLTKYQLQMKPGPQRILGQLRNVTVLGTVPPPEPLH